MPQPPDAEYWAAEQDPKKLAAKMKVRVDRYRSSSDMGGRRAVWARAVRLYYGLDADGGFRTSRWVNFEGAEGEIIALRANVLRALLKQVLVQTTGSRPSFDCRPIAYDAQTNEIVEIGNAWLDKQLDDGVEAKAIASCLYAILMGEGALVTTWDFGGGELVTVQAPDGSMVPMTDELGTPMTKGAMRVLSLRPDEIVRDPDVSGGHDAHRWFILTVQRDRWELAAQYPEYAHEILHAPSRNDLWLYGAMGQPIASRDIVNGDVVTTYELYHKRSPAMPEGRVALMVGDCVVASGPLPYKNLPIAWMVSDREPGSAYGYGESFDLLALQQALDSVVMQMVTNRENFGRANIFTYTGTTVEPYDLAGPRLITGQQPPVVLDLSNSGIASGEQMSTMLLSLMQMMTGVNDAVMGDTSKSASGAALAMQQQLAATFNSSNQFAFVAMMQTAMNQQLEIARQFVSEEQLIHIAGKNRAPVVKRFKGSDFAALDGVSVELGSASMRTSGMRHQIANELLQAGVLKSADQYLAMIATGRLEPALEGPEILETMAERLMLEVQEGRPYQPIATHPHAMMISRLSLLVADPAISGEPGKLQMVLQLINGHSELWNSMTTSPAGIAILAATGQDPSPAAQMLMAMQAPQMPPQAPDAPPAGGAPSEEPTQNPQVQTPQDQQQQLGQNTAPPPNVNAPQLPEGAVPMA